MSFSARFRPFSSLSAGEEIKSRNQIGLVVITIQRTTLVFYVHQVRTAEWIKLQTEFRSDTGAYICINCSMASSFKPHVYIL